jgi:polygalacturonase
MKVVQPDANFGPAGGLNVRQCGAVGDGQTSCTAALQRAIDQCGSNGGGTVLVPAGGYVTGSLWMRSNVTLHLEAGARLLGSQNIADYPVWVSHWEGNAQPGYAAVISGESLSNVAVTGRGTIDGRAQFWWDHFRNGTLEYTRPRLVRLVDCRDVLIEGVTCVNSGIWTLHPTACDNVVISRVTVRNPPDSPNTDGINPDSCCNVRISDCHIDVGDDCLTLKSGSEDDRRDFPRPCENITVTNCTMLRGHGGVVIGSEMTGGVRNVAISNCVFRGTDRGLRIKSRRGRGGFVEDVRADNIVMDGVHCPIVVNLFYGCEAWDQPRVTDRSPHPVDYGTPRVRRLRFSNILARQARYAAVFLLGLPEMNIEDVTLEGLSLYLDREHTSKGAPEMAPGLTETCRAGVVIENARNVKLRRVDLHDQLGPAVTLRNSSRVEVTEFSAARDRSSPMMVIDGEEFEAVNGEVGAAGRDWRKVPWPDRDRAPHERAPASAKSGNGNGNGH